MMPIEGDAYKQAIGVLYAVAYTVKMSKMGDHRMDGLIAAEGYVNDMSDTEAGRHHHEIYLSDARRVALAKWKTVVRHLIKPAC